LLFIHFHPSPVRIDVRTYLIPFGIDIYILSHHNNGDAHRSVPCWEGDFLKVSAQGII